MLAARRSLGMTSDFQCLVGARLPEWNPKRKKLGWHLKHG